ncbi:MULTISPECIES: 5-formyltetrahydrofolate cyclo-ligase [unclassified Caulobacter]|uniref:5-formyltetrahydrofolate cyclo-ligase n=1 Tax=unclassified Caulobacter TaxID=2648921 RepID=UPI000782F46A|nr:MULTISPECIES: 5-formyltetrahydrofolate cyclo-ligase [unclassified Caulobacter]AZS22703.1 5-formyltetrahydrofolate cyclo-ligase [Caulobacter sp. FWC26]
MRPLDRDDSLHGMTIVDPIAAKTALRVFLRNQRKQLAREHPEADWMIAEVARAPLQRLFPNPKGKIAALYHGMGSEISPRLLAEQMAESGWTLALPAVVDRDGGKMVFRRWDVEKPLKHDEIGLRAPAPDQPMVIPDLVVTPLLAFQRDGTRLGQGGGYYDRALEFLRARRSIFVLGLAYSGQQMENLPHEPHDQRLDAILTEKEYIAVNAMAG